MREVTYNGKRIELYDSPSELPQERFALFNRMILIDSNIGADLEKFDEHMGKVAKFIQLGEHDKAIKEIANLRQCYFLIMNDVNPDVKAFGCLVKSINGKEYTGNTEAEVDKILYDLKKVRLPMGLIRVVIDSIKKKSKASYKRFFQRRWITERLKNITVR